MKRILKIIRKNLLSLIVPKGFYFSHKGYCPCCDKNVRFLSYDSWLRDNFKCSHCSSIPRERALMLILKTYFPDWKTLVVHESSPIDRGASLSLKNNCNNYISSQYFPGVEFGTMVEDQRNEDLENQTFENESFDLVITQDVMEHIYNPENAFKEIARTLKKGGAHVFTVPIINKHNKTEVWATRGENGEPQFLKYPEYHSNPVDPKGSPVTMHWGFDIVDFIREKSGLDTTIEYVNDLDYGIRAEYIEVLVSKKN